MVSSGVKRKEPRSKVISHSLRGVDWADVIDRCFRYLEMIVITTLIATVVSAVSPGWAIAIQIGLGLAAGLYLAIPAAQRLRKRESLITRRTTPIMRYAAPTFLFATAAMQATSFLVPLLKQTVSFDPVATRRAYQRYVDAERQASCIEAGAKAGSGPDDTIERCRAILPITK